MTPYTAPLADIKFILKHVAESKTLQDLPDFQETSDDMIAAILEEANRLGSEVLAPINYASDQEGCHFDGENVTTPKGHKEAYHQYIEGGWNAVSFPEEIGGMGQPLLLANALQEIWQSSNLGFSLCPLLNQAAIDMLLIHGSDDMKEKYLSSLLSGEWTGTMNLTEPQAGSDLAALKAKALRKDDHYLIKGQKIFISYGDHDYTDNIIHLVLARTEDAPEGVKGISVFLVPKFLVNEDGSLGARNDVKTVSIEHKMGIHASPTCVLSFGDTDGAIGYLIGEENRGLEYMFTMMNNARLGVGIQGVAIAERALQQALAYSQDRVQGSDISRQKSGSVTIDHHPDIQRTLLSMKSKVFAARGICYLCATAHDLAHHGETEEVRAKAARANDLLTPLAKAWSTDIALDVTSDNIQIHGGMGYIEETGAAQHFRDARITPIYEGTNGIQANDLMFRKILRDKGATLLEFSRDISSLAGKLKAEDSDLAQNLAADMFKSLEDLETATRFALDNASSPEVVAAGATYYLELLSLVVGGHVMAKTLNSLLSTNENSQSFKAEKYRLIDFYRIHLLSDTASLAHKITKGYSTILG